MTAHASDAHAAEPTLSVPTTADLMAAPLPAFDPRSGGTLVWIAEIEAALGGGTLPVVGPAQAEDAQAAIPPDVAPAGGADVLRVSDLGWRGREGEAGGATPYPPLLADGPNIERRIALAPGADDTYAWGTIRLARAGDIPVVPLAGRNTARRPVRIRAGLRGWDAARGRPTHPRAADLRDAFGGLAGAWTAREDGAEVPLRDPGAWLDLPIATRRFLGTGGGEGTSDMAGRPWPLVRGGTAGNPVRSCPAVLVDRLTRRYRWTDGAGTLSTVRQNGAPVFTNGGDVATIGAAAPGAGAYVSCNAAGEFVLGSDPVGDITVDGSVAGGATPAEIIASLLAGLGLPAGLLDLASVGAVAAAIPYTAGAAWTGQETGRQAIRPLLAALNARLVATRAGQLRLWPLRALPATVRPAARYDASNAVSVAPVALPDVLATPSALWTVGFNRTQVVTQTVGATVTDADERARLSETWRWANWYDPGNLLAYPGAPRPDLVETALLLGADATDLAAVIGALWGRRRALHAVTLHPADAIHREIGDPVQVAWDADGLRDGPIGQVVGDGLRAGQRSATLLVLV